MLSINPSEVILTRINFFLLFFLLRKFLYRPVMKFMDERNRGIEEKMELERSVQRRLDELDAEADAQRRQAVAQAGETVARAKSDYENLSKRLLEESKEQSAINRKKAALSAGWIDEREKQRLDSNAERLVKVLVERMLNA